MANKTPFQIQVPRRNSHCLWSETIFSSGGDYYSFVCEGVEGYAREDYSPEGWDKQGQIRCQEQNGVYWKGKVPERKAPILPEDRDERAFQLLRESLERDDPDSIQDAFMLGLYLQRRRRLALRKEVEKEGKVFNLYENLATEEMLTLPRLNLSQVEVEKVQVRLAEKFKGEEEPL